MHDDLLPRSTGGRAAFKALRETIQRMLNGYVLGSSWGMCVSVSKVEQARRTLPDLGFADEYYISCCNSPASSARYDGFWESAGLSAPRHWDEQCAM